MKKFNISSQLLILFFSILLIATCSFTILNLVYVSSIADDEVYSRLTTYVNFISKYDISSNGHDYEDMKVGYIVDNGDYEIVKSLENFVTREELNEILEKIKKSREDSNYTSVNYLARGEFEKDLGNSVYYVCKVENNMEKYTIAFTDSTFSSILSRKIALEMLVVFFLLLLLASYVIFLWSYKLTKRIQTLQSHILTMPRNKYEIAYEDDSLDEIGELSRSIEEMRKEIGKSEKTKQEMLQNLSHDFKTPISVIRSYAEAIEDGMGDEESLKVIMNQADLLKKKVNRLLQYNSLEYLKKDKEFEEIDMKELVLEIVNNHKYQIKLDFELDLDEGIIFTGYRENWHTVIDNIIDNAKRYAKSKIKIVVKKNRLRIYNDGDHIDEQFLNSVFKPYEKGSKGEFGLGMSIVKKTVEFFGYTLKVCNEEVGVSFIITNSNK